MTIMIWGIWPIITMHQHQKCVGLQVPESIDHNRRLQISQVLIYQQYVEFGFPRDGECFLNLPTSGGCA